MALGPDCKILVGLAVDAGAVDRILFHSSVTRHSERRTWLRGNETRKGARPFGWISIAVTGLFGRKPAIPLNPPPELLVTRTLLKKRFRLSRRGRCCT